MHTYSLRLQLPPTLDFEERLNNALDFCKRADIDDVMFFIGCEDISVGHITKEQALPYVEVIKKASKFIKQAGMTVSLNPWMTIGHYDGGRKKPAEQNFQGLVGESGETAEICACPLDENWRKYYVDLLNFYVETIEPDVLWLEDDFRLHGHRAVGVINQGCFCDKHLAIYNERLGTNYDRQTLVDLISTDQKVRKVYLDVCRETMEGTIEYICKNVKGQKRFGLMTGGSYFGEARRFSNIFETLGEGRERPLNRSSLIVVRQSSPQQAGKNFNAVTMLNCFLTSEKAEIVTEVENNPHTYYTNSVKFNRFRQMFSVASLTKGSTFSIFEFNGNGAYHYERLADMYKKVKPYLNKVSEFDFAIKDMTGVNILVNEDVAYAAKVQKGRTFFNGGVNVGSQFFNAWFELLGINCHFTSDKNLLGKVVAVSGNVLYSLQKQEIVNLFKNNSVIIDGEGVEALFDLGLEHLIDAKAYKVHRIRQTNQSFQQINSDQKIFGITNMRVTNSFSSGDYVNVEYKNAPEKAYTKAMNCFEQKVGEGCALVNGTLIFPYLPTGETYAFYHPLIEWAIKSFIKESGKMDGERFFVAEENVAPYSYKRGEQTMLTCVNFCDDDYDSLTIETDAKFSSIMVYNESNPNGKVADFSYENGTLSLNEKLGGMESMVIVFC